MTTSSAAPSVTIDIEPARTVVFDYGLLEAIEDRMGKTINMIAFDDFGAMAVADKAKPSAVMEAMRRVSVKFVVSFVAACLGCDRGLVSSIVPPDKLSKVFNALAGGFFEAVRQFNGMEAVEHPQTPADQDPPASPSGV